MRNALLSLTLLVCFALEVNAQSNSLIEDEFEYLTLDWLTKSSELRVYSGISEYCANPSYRSSVNQILNAIHVYDSLILRKLEDPTYQLSASWKEQQKTVKDVSQMEEKYGVKAFISQMREACIERNDIEKREEYLRSGVGIESYDGKIFVLETEMIKYLNRVDKLVLRINDHLHLLHIAND